MVRRHGQTAVEGANAPPVTAGMRRTGPSAGGDPAAAGGAAR